MKETIALIAISIDNLKTFKYIFFIKHWLFRLLVISVSEMIKNYVKKKNQMRY